MVILASLDQRVQAGRRKIFNHTLMNLQLPVMEGYDNSTKGKKFRKYCSWPLIIETTWIMNFAYEVINGGVLAFLKRLKNCGHFLMNESSFFNQMLLRGLKHQVCISYSWEEIQYNDISS